MGRLPGGIVDETRDYIIKEVDTLNRSKLLKFSASSSAQRKASQSQDSLPGINPTAGSTGMRSRNQSPKMRGLFTANTVRGMRYPLRRTSRTAPRNIVTNDLQQGHFTCTPSITIGRKTRGIAGEYIYGIEGPEPPRPLPVPFDPPFMFSSPTKKMHGSGTYDGMFQKPSYMAQGPPAAWPSFEKSSQRMIAQTLYPIQVMPTTVQAAS